MSTKIYQALYDLTRKEAKMERIKELVDAFNSLDTVMCYRVKQMADDVRGVTTYNITRQNRKNPHGSWGNTVFEGTRSQAITFMLGMIESWKATLNRF
jgi:hypothetical protein